MSEGVREQFVHAFSVNKIFLPETFCEVRYSNIYERVIFIEQLIKQAMVGDDVALAKLLQHEKPRLLQRAYSYVKNRADAEDIVQQTFISAHASLSELRQPRYFSTWLFKIMIRQSFKVLKQEARRHELEQQLLYTVTAVQHEAASYDELYSALQRIPRQYELALVLHYVYGFKVIELAELLQKPLNTVKMHLHRGRHALRLQLEQQSNKQFEQKDVRRMLNEQLLQLATNFAKPTAYQQLMLQNYTNEASMFLWQSEDMTDSVFVRLTADGKLDDFAKTPQHDGAPISTEAQQQIATRFFHAQHPEALRYFTAVAATELDGYTSFLFTQQVGGLPLHHYYCRIHVTTSGEVVQFTYTGYCAEEPLMPRVLYKKDAIISALLEAPWTLRATYVHAADVAVERSGVVLLYDTEHLHAAYDAATGEPSVTNEDLPHYEPFPHVAATTQSIEQLIDIPDDYALVSERYDEHEFEQQTWRRKGQLRAVTTSEDFIDANFMNIIRIKTNCATGRLYSFMKVVEEKSTPHISAEQCLQKAAQLIQAHYTEYVPYVVVATLDEDDEQLFFHFALCINGLLIEHDGFYVTVNKRGDIVRFRAPFLCVAELEQLRIDDIKPFHELACESLHATLRWEASYDDDKMSERLVYRMTTRDGAPVVGIDARSGHIIASKRGEHV